MRQMIPSPSPPPVPVHIVNGADPWVILTAAIATLTLAAVGWQIYIANRELDYVKRDLKNNERLLKEAFRRPDLSLFAIPQPRFLNVTDYLPINLILMVTNAGTKSSHELMVHLLVPMKVLAPSGMTTPTTIVPRDDGDYCRFEVLPVRDSILWPGTAIRLTQELPLAKDVGDVTMFYRIYDEYDMYPPSGDYAKFVCQRALIEQLRTLHAGRQPQAGEV